MGMRCNASKSLYNILVVHHNTNVKLLLTSYRAYLKMAAKLTFVYVHINLCILKLKIIFTLKAQFICIQKNFKLVPFFNKVYIFMQKN